jgi:hypothetical protein
VTAPDTPAAGVADPEDQDGLNDDLVLEHDETVEKHGSRFLQKLMILGILVTVVIVVLRSRQNARGRFVKSMV